MISFVDVLLEGINRFFAQGKGGRSKKWKTFAEHVHFQVSEIGE